MKNIIVAISFVLNSYMFLASQIIEGISTHDYDSCSFEQEFTLVTLEIDTLENNIWQIGKPQKQIFSSTYSDSLCIVTDTIFTYPNNNYSQFTLKIPIIFYDNAINVTFKHKIDSDSLKDGGYIEVSHDKGLTWDNVLFDPILIGSDQMNYFLSENLYNSNDSLVENNFGFSGQSDWIETKMQWILFYSVKSLTTDTLYLRFIFKSDSIANNRDGWIIDNFLVSSVYFGGSVIEGEINQINVSPNPTTNVINIEESSKFESFEIIDLKGEIVLKDKITSPKIDISELKSGIYLLNLVSFDKSIVRSKVLKE